MTSFSTFRNLYISTPFTIQYVLMFFEPLNFKSANPAFPVAQSL